MATLTGKEALEIVGRAPTFGFAATGFGATVAEIASLAATNGLGIANADITTVGNGTLTAAALIGGQITRTGPTANFTDTTDTAAAIITALSPYIVGEEFIIRIKNETAFVQTLSAGANVTLPVQVLIAPYSVGNYFATIVDGTHVTLSHTSTSSLTNKITDTARSYQFLSTNGNGTITAASIVNGITVRSGVSSGVPVTDQTDTAANIIAAEPGFLGKVGASFIYYYLNNINAPVQIDAGFGVTVVGSSTALVGGWIMFLVQYTGVGTITMTGIASGLNTGQPPSFFTANGATPVDLNDSSISPTSIITFTLKTPGGTVGAYPAIQTITPGVKATVACTAGDTSVYNYVVQQ